MPVERKCPKCNTWNKEEDHCNNCGEPISPRQLEKNRMEKLKAKEEAKVPSKMDIFLDKLKKHQNPFVKILYALLSSVWAVYMFLLGIILYLAAATPG